MIEPLSQNKRKLLASLRQTKHRRAEGLFIAEGRKCIGELAGHFRCRLLAATAAWVEENGACIGALHAAEVCKATRADLERISSMATAPDVVAAFEIPEATAVAAPLADDITLALDGVQDPGNMGTIIRTCNWFGISRILCSHDTVDIYNPKVVQATMGALATVEVQYADLAPLLTGSGLPVYGTFLDGENIRQADPPRAAVIVMGNEGNGISAPVAACVNHRLYIPPYPAEGRHVESLNVAIATALTLSWCRQ